MAITREDEFYGEYWKIQDLWRSLDNPGTGGNQHLAVLIPREGYIYDVDLNHRTIEVPEYLSLLNDHYAETIYFRMNRFFDSQDMADTACVIQYLTANKEPRLYLVPYYDIETYHETQQMLIPWLIDKETTKYAGKIEFNMVFFKLDKTEKYLTFFLSTLTATSTIKPTLRILESDKYYIPIDMTQELFDAKTNTYFIKNESGDMVKATNYSAAQTYYVMTSSYDDAANTLETLIGIVKKLQRGNQCYWWEASKRSDMLKT